MTKKVSGLTAFPKIFHLGQDYISRIFHGPVEVTEKLDGSQFVVGKLDGELVMRSKGTMIYDYESRNENDLFYPVIQHFMDIAHYLPEGRIFYGETLCKPKHNTLAYSRVPKNHFMLFGVGNLRHQFCQNYEDLADWAEFLHVEVVPCLYHGTIKNPEMLKDIMDKESVLGGSKMEGVVIKNYQQPFLLGGQPIPVMAGKYVSEAFKEVHRTSWSKEHTAGGKWQAFKAGYNTEARWNKAIQHLEEKGELERAPRDIGKLITEIQRDITEEEQENIKQFLWNHQGKEVLRSACVGFPEFYKSKLLERGFEQ
jgi:hypothetical protein